MQKRLILAAIGLTALSAPLAAQIQPLPDNPLAKKPTLQIASLGFTEVPSGTILLPVTTGTGAGSTTEVPLRIRTVGGGGRVTLSIAVDGVNASRFTLVDPPPITSVGGQQIVTAGIQQQPVMAAASLEADPVFRMLKVAGTVSFPSTMPGEHRVTVTARESNGNSVSRSFTVRFLRAAAKPALAASATASQERDTDRSAGFNAAQLDFVPTGEVPFVPYNSVQIRPASGSVINWHPLDPGSEIICLYGSFRYACETENPVAPDRLPATLTVKVPDIGRGKSVRIVLTGPYGESNAVSTTIDSEVDRTVRRRLSVAQFGGKHLFRSAPAERGTDLPKNGDPVKCGVPYLVWKDQTVEDKVFYSPPPGALPIGIKLAGDPKVRVVSVPRGQRITDNPDASWAQLESDVPAGITNFYVFDTTYSYTTQVGECADRRR